MKEFGPPDTFHLRAASGWLELGNHLEANEELEKIVPQLRAHPDVLEIRWQIYAKEHKWGPCAEIANTLTKIAPKRASGWVQLAYSLRRETSNGIKAASDVLLLAVEKFPKVWTIPFNLACYSSQMNRMDDAQSWLKKAMEIDEQAVKAVAIQDPDLKPLWDSMGGTLWKRE